MEERFACNTPLSVATIENDAPHVRIVNAYYFDGAFYAVTYTLSNKMKHIEKNPAVAVCGEWFTATGFGENLGYVLDDSNTEMMKKLREVFASWYTFGPVNEEDENTCLLKIKLTKGVILVNEKQFNIDF